MEILKHYLEAALADTMKKLNDVKPEIDAILKRHDADLQMHLRDDSGLINLADSEKLHPRYSDDIPQKTFDFGFRLFDELKTRFGDRLDFKTLRLTDGFRIFVTPK